MELSEFQSRLAAKLDEFSALRNETTSLINEFIADNEGKIRITYGGVTEMTELEGKVDGMAMFAAWIEDRLNGDCGIPNHHGYSRSRAKKVRKAFGYTY